MKSLNLEKQPIYTKQLISKKIKIPFSDLNNAVEKLFKEYAEKFIVGKCSKEGYISTTHIKIVQYSSAKCVSSYTLYDVLFEFDVYNPYEGQELYAKIVNITKIGIKALITTNSRSNPITVFASRLHNEDIVMKDDNIDLNSDEKTNKHVYSENDIIKIRVIGHRFEINDSSVYVLGKIIEKNK
tara:strand:+ start:673 stop:1224 length:552 start_codon:yes stop_codon:yes gene_type:complete